MSCHGHASNHQICKCSAGSTSRVARSLVLVLRIQVDIIIAFLVLGVTRSNNSLRAAYAYADERVLRPGVTCAKKVVSRVRALVRATANSTNELADVVTTYPRGLAKAGATTEAARRSVTKRDACIACYRITVYGWISCQWRLKVE